MIDVYHSDMATSNIKYYRENIYNNNNFKKKFENNLKKEVCAIDTTFVPDQFGGWIINATVNRNKGIEKGIKFQTSDCYINKVSHALSSTIHDIDKKYPIPSILLDLSNVIITGTNSIAIKI